MRASQKRLFPPSLRPKSPPTPTKLFRTSFHPLFHPLVHPPIHPATHPTTHSARQHRVTCCNRRPLGGSQP
ncbi:unnamed protein product [Protopolystoma xenopodis]|uniref:Uncharacterized protein n=1 Tax=Protopolystoma xenopodis TaxID=117903 RepID=A0A3S5B6N4_9PLAT|nr:unnamed protein product [Protopolystoma xenopodis]